MHTRRDFLKQAGVAAAGLSWSQGNRCLGVADVPEINPERLAALRTKLKGRLVVPGEATYQSTKRVFYWNPKTERSPVAVVQCGDEQDAQRAVEFARTHELELSVRSGGHSHLAWGSSNGIVIDLSPLKQIQIDAGKRIMRAQAGVFGGEAARAAGAYGLVPVLGQCPGVSATGVTLGGGLGWLSGLFGACCDNLLAARLVTADATTIDVNAESDPDLFWALRGAGANFGVTTNFEAQLHSIGTVLAGDIHFAVRDAREVMRGFRDIMHDAPDGFQATLNLTSGDRGLFISFSHAGDEKESESMMRKLRLIATPTKELVKRQPFADLAEKAAATNPGNSTAQGFRGIQTVYREQITDEIIDIYADQLAQATPDVVMGLSHYMHGEVCRVQPDATAFPHRQAHSIHLRVAYNWSDPADHDKRFAWGDEWLKSLRPSSNESIYANYQTYETRQGSPSLFGQNYSRLLTLKNKYDPTNLFRRNANIAPARGNSG
jgi:FAD/FMN-containing dehydrogenase